MGAARARRRGGGRPLLAQASLLALALGLGAGCSQGGYHGRDASVPDAARKPDPSVPDLAGSDMPVPTDLGPPGDSGAPHDLAGPRDFAMPPDLSGGTGPIKGGPCISGATGATAFRVHWTNGAGTADVDYEVFGLPDTTRWHVGVYGYVIGFTPEYVDPFLGPGGVGLDDSDFIEVQLSTVGVHHISSITLSVYGRSYSVDTSGSFNWLTFTGSGATPIDYVSNVAPYSWYPADATADINPDDGMIEMRIKADASSDSLVVNRLELCIDAS